jgi:putative endonuclease
MPAATGRLGEDLAAAHLRRRGFRILDRNVRGPGGEIDLIATDGRVLAFVEVKTTRARPGARPAPHPPLERLGRAQRSRLRRLALRWLLARREARPRPALLRFDAIAVVLDAAGRLMALEHVEGAW